MSEARNTTKMQWFKHSAWAVIRTVPLLVMASGVLYVLTHWNSLDQPLVITPGQSTFQQVLGTPEVVFGIRLGALAIGFYLASSVLALAIHGRWIIKAGTGGVDTGALHSLGTLREATTDLEERVIVLEKALLSTATRLEARLDQQKAGLDLMTTAIEELIEKAKDGPKIE